MHTFVSVIIPARNAAHTLADCLLALRAQSYPRDRFEVIVVDDGSADPTAAVAARLRAKVISIPPSGPAAARNRGVEASRGDILLFTDADCAPDSGWIQTLVRSFDDPAVIAAKGTYRTEQASLTARFVQAEYESRYRRMERLESIDFIDTYSAAYSREAFVAAGGFDESFPSPSVEDQELSFRLTRAGGRMAFCPEAVVVHRHAADPWAYFRKKLKIGYWKMRVLSRFPQKALRDSHTPAGLKLEIALLWSAAAALPFIVAAGLRWLPLALLGAFFAAGAPLCARAARKDARLAFLGPLLLLLRAAGLGCGMLLGALGGQLSFGAARNAREEARMAGAGPQA
jgi:cellulose synthase/poly-beta-1,6-N-acetylglucosamine synthase-like glycosyltransferase